jgi:hypothetical protein
MPLLVAFASAWLPTFSFAQRNVAPASATQPPYVGFDRNDYPGDAALPDLRSHFVFTGYWLTNPPGATSNTWLGKRPALLRAGFGFLVLANGKLDKEILRAQKSGTRPGQLGQQDGRAAAEAAKREGFPEGTIVFLDQEEGGRLLDEQAGYLLGWTEAVAATEYRPGVYASGQPVPDGTGPDGKPASITTVQDIRGRIAAGHLHPVAFWIAQDACPPAPGCVLHAPPLSASGTPDFAPDHTSPLVAWQYAQSPRRPEITRACGKTYAADGNCYSPAPAHFFIDLSSSNDPDPSHGR